MTSAEPEWVPVGDPRIGVREPRWHQPPARPGFCSTPYHTWASNDGVQLPGAMDACAPQCCAGHRWTCCGDCGRDGDRAGDEAALPCSP
jgi:hypothetical protein